MKLMFSVFVLALLMINASAQEAEQPADSTIVEFVSVSKMAEYKGGMQKFYKDLYDKLEYPAEAKAAGHKGRSFVTFVVETDGKITNLAVQRKLGAGCDEAALKALKQLSFSKPALMNGKPVRMRLNIPVAFGVDPGKF